MEPPFDLAQGSQCRLNGFRVGVTTWGAEARAWKLRNQRELGIPEPVECAKAMAEAEKVLSELSLGAPRTRQSNPVRPSSVDEKPSEQSPLSPRAALPSLDRLRLDPDLDFVIHDDGMIELTAVGFRRMLQAHSAGLDAVIVVDRREVLRLPASMRGHDPCAAGRRQAAKGSRRCTDLIEAHVRRTQPVAELLKAEQSSEIALNMINKERERREIEVLATVVFGRDAGSSRRRAYRAGACRGWRTRTALRTSPRGACGDDPPQRDI